MKSYYIYQSDKQHGPYTISQLEEMQINPAVPVWADGFKEWVKAREVPELQHILLSAPPPFNTPPLIPTANQELNSTTEKVGFFIGKKGKAFLLFVLIIAAIFFIARVQESESHSGIFEGTVFQKSPEQLREELKQQEMMNPTKYVQGRIGYRKNLIGETVLEGALNNTATVANFKDVVLKVTWISKTNTSMGVSRLTVYEYIGAGKAVSYKVKTFGPSKYADIAVEIESATAVQ